MGLRSTNPRSEGEMLKFVIKQCKHYAIQCRVHSSIFKKVQSSVQCSVHLTKVSTDILDIVKIFWIQESSMKVKVFNSTFETHFCLPYCYSSNTGQYIVLPLCPDVVKMLSTELTVCIPRQHASFPLSCPEKLLKTVHCLALRSRIVWACLFTQEGLKGFS